jgi:hypothetical protein
VFNRDHVIPEAFGRFKHNLVLKDCVCAGCNSYFGNELELILGRDSGEALLRLRYGIKPPNEAREVRNRRITLTVHVPRPWMGARIILVPDPSGTALETELVPQVAFRVSPESDWLWFTEGQLEKQELPEVCKQKGIEIRVMAPSAVASERIIQKLKNLGIDFRKKGVLEQPITDDGTMLTQALYEVDQTILRAIGKIAFNYAAYVHGAEVVLAPDFDHFRRYVRYAETPPISPVVYPTSRRILFDESRVVHMTNGHLVTFDWNANGDGLLGQVSLFNSITYLVLLCPHYSGIWRELRSGHHFDIEIGEVTKLASARLTRVRVGPLKRAR